MFFSFPEDAQWNADCQAVEFGVEVGEYQGVVRVPRRVFQRLLLPGQFGEYMFTASFTARDPTADPQPTTATASGPWGCWRPGLEIPLTLLVRTDEVMELEINSARSIDELVANEDGTELTLPLRQKPMVRPGRRLRQKLGSASLLPRA